MSANDAHPDTRLREDTTTDAASSSLDLGRIRSWWLVLLGPVAALALWLLLPDSLSSEGRAAAGVGLWMALWWMTEAVPIPVTSFLPLALFPLVTSMTFAETAGPFANSVIFLVLGGVILGLATEKSGLHIRVALLTIRIVGTRPAQIVFGLMLASAFVSAWVSNTASAVIMVPIAVSISSLVARVAGHRDEKFTVAMLLGVAYGVTIGSTATVIGQPPMALMKAYLLESHDYDMEFGRWMLVGVPWAVVMLVVAWLVLTKLIFRSETKEIPGGREMIQEELDKLGAMSPAEKRVSAIFATAIFFWVAVPFIAEIPAVAENLPWLGSISDSQVAITAAIACFIVPSGVPTGDDRTGNHSPLLTWSSARDIPWGLLVLFGGGLALSSAFTNTGFSDWIGNQVAVLDFLPNWLIILVIAVIGLALTELTSNTATAAAFFPIFGSVAVGLGIDPVFMTIAVTLAVCSAYMLPVATPSNAVAFSSGQVTIKQMMRAGVWLNLFSLVILMAFLYTLVPVVF